MKKEFLSLTFYENGIFEADFIKSQPKFWNSGIILKTLER